MKFLIERTEETFLNNKSDKITISSFYEELLQLNSKMVNSLIINMQKYEQSFIQNKCKMTSEHMERYSAPLGTLETKNNMNMRYHHIHTRMIIITNANNKC